jgi:trans-aconitate methyltransferase
MTTTLGPDRWSKANSYETFMGRWSRTLARRFVASLAAPAGARWLDLGCGTGALTAAILADAQPAAIVACDPSEDFVGYARAHQHDGRVQFEHANLNTLPVDHVNFDVIASNLVLNFLPDARAGLRGMRERGRPGGLVAAGVWDYASGMQMFRAFWDAARTVDARAASLDEATRFSLCTPECLAETMQDAGFGDVATGSITIDMTFTSFDDYWAPFLEGLGPAGTYVSSLDAGMRDDLAGALRARLPADRSGVIALTARAWTVRGRVPGA